MEQPELKAAADQGPIFIATSHGVIQGWPKNDETDDTDEEEGVVFIAR